MNPLGNDPHAPRRSDSTGQSGQPAPQEAQSGAPSRSNDDPERQPAPQDGRAQRQATQQGTGPIGEGDHVVRDGECVSSIAKSSGHFWETIWDDAANSDLKAARKNPNTLLPGDRITVPELEPKEEPCATEEHHRFRRKGEPAMLRIRLVEEPREQTQQAAGPREPERSSRSSDPDECDVEERPAEREPRPDQPRANVPYTLIVDGEQSSGTTDSDGRLEAQIPGNARRGRLILNPGTEEQEEVWLQLGHVGPISEISGVKERLQNLGFDCGAADEEETADLEEALRAFQEKHGLEATGRIDEATRDRLLAEHGC